MFVLCLKDLEWGASDNFAPSDAVEDDGQWWESYEDDAIPAPLHDVPGWPAKASVIGQVGGVAMDTDKNLVVFHRADRRWDARLVRRHYW